MRSDRSKMVVRLAAGVVLFGAPFASAAVLTGDGGRGTPGGNSGLIAIADYVDTFRGVADGSANPARVYVAAVQGPAAYPIEQRFGNPAVSWHSPNQPAGVGEFSFASDTQGQVPGGANPVYPGPSGAGSETGFTQTGAGTDFGIPYGLRTKYVVQVDAVTLADRIDITSSPAVNGEYNGIFTQGSLSVFFRNTGGISLFNGVTDTPIPIATLDTGLRPTDTGRWNNYAVLFDQDAKQVGIYVNEVFRGSLDLTQVAGGLYQNFSNATVGVGGGFGNGESRLWTDNFQVGAVPEPGVVGLAGVAAVAGLTRRRRQR